MHCVLIGVTTYSPRSDAEDAAAWKEVTQQVTEVDGITVNWVSSSKSNDEGKPTQLLCATTDAPVLEDVVAATAKALGDCHETELWASAPAILPLRPLNGYNTHIILHDNTNNVSGDSTSTSWEERASSTMKEWGMFTQSSLLDASEIQELRQCVNDEISSIENLITLHRPDIDIGQDIMSFQEIASRGNERFDLLLQQTSNAKSFVERIVLDRISSTLENILDGYVNQDVNFDVSVVYSKPGATNQGWHADGDHQKGANDGGWDVDGWKTRLAEPYALCLFIPLIDLDDATGFTQFWPASHRNRGLMGFGPAAEIAEATWDGKCKAGDAIWYDYRLMHRGMGNSSKAIRPVVQVLFKKSWYDEKRNYGTDSLQQMKPI